VGVEKVRFPQNSRKLGDRKCLGKLKKWFVEHPDAILFFANFAGRSFSTPTRFIANGRSPTPPTSTPSLTSHSPGPKISAQ
jgi:hypothetical protein